MRRYSSKSLVVEENESEIRFLLPYTFLNERSGQKGKIQARCLYLLSGSKPNSVNGEIKRASSHNEIPTAEH